jgi:hypothetical protein
VLAKQVLATPPALETLLIGMKMSWTPRLYVPAKESQEKIIILKVSDQHRICFWLNSVTFVEFLEKRIIFLNIR